MTDFKECLLVCDQRHDLNNGDFQLLNEFVPLLSDEQDVTEREQEVFAVCAEKLVVLLDGKIGVG